VLQPRPSATNMDTTVPPPNGRGPSGTPMLTSIAAPTPIFSSVNGSSSLPQGLFASPAFHSVRPTTMASFLSTLPQLPVSMIQASMANGVTRQEVASAVRRDFHPQ
jgi:hypothetical protein